MNEPLAELAALFRYESRLPDRELIRPTATARACGRWAAIAVRNGIQTYKEQHACPRLRKYLFVRYPINEPVPVPVTGVCFDAAQACALTSFGRVSGPLYGA